MPSFIFFKNIILFLRKYYVFIFISLVVFFLIILPFILWNNLERFDHSGQYASVYYIKNFFWPFAGGWNSFFLSGFPQGLFYPSFFHWIVALFGFIIPLDLSYKIILSISILLFPCIVFLLSNKLFKSTVISGSLLIIVSIFYYFNLGLNDNLYSDIYYGMSSHLFSLTLFFIYLYSLFILIKDNKKWYFPTVILFILIITHIITSTSAVLFSFILLILSWKNNILRKNLFKHYIYSFLMSSFFIIPFLFNIKYISGGDMTSSETALISLIIPLLLILSFFIFKIKSEYSIFFKTISIFNVFIIILYLVSRSLSVNNFPIHFGRLLIYPFLMSPFLLFYYIKDYLINWSKLNLILLICFSFYLFSLSVTPIGPLDIKILPNLNNFIKNGRVIVTGDSVKLDDRFHSTRTKLAIDYKIPVAGGLFTESSSNGWFMMSLLRSFEKDSSYVFTWGYKDLDDVINLKWGSQIFGINYEYRISDKKPSEEESDYLNLISNKIRLLDNEKVVSILSGDDSPFYYQSFYKINDTGIAEVLDIKPFNIKKDWNYSIKKWWSTDWLKIEDSDFYKKPILIYNKDIEEWNLSTINKMIPFVEDKKMNSFVIDASEFKSSVPIYVKVEYFPYWKAYDEFGKELEIYKASPNFMLVYGNGKITFKYIEDVYYKYSLIISGLTIISFIFNFIYKRYFVKNIQ
jgi:hypothetical protein